MTDTDKWEVDADGSAIRRVEDDSDDGESSGQTYVCLACSSERSVAGAFRQRIRQWCDGDCDGVTWHERAD